MNSIKQRVSALERKSASADLIFVFVRDDETGAEAARRHFGCEPDARTLRRTVFLYEDDADL